jgi:AMP-polyphosphate phosphotransferase
MLETLDLNLTMSKGDFRDRLTPLRKQLCDLQQLIRVAKIPVVVLFEGWDASGKGDSIGSLAYPLDPRGFKVYSAKEPNEEEYFRPFLWRFWSRLPGKGNFLFLDRSWYRAILEDRVDGIVSRKSAESIAYEIREFERQLSDDGIVLIKFWLHISKQEQKYRLKNIGVDQYEQWRLTQPDWKKRRRYKKYAKAAEDLLVATSTANVPWTLVEANDHRFRRIKVLDTVVTTLKRVLSERGLETQGPTGVRPNPLNEAHKPGGGSSVLSFHISPSSTPTVLERVDLTKRLDREEYAKKIGKLQNRLRELGLECYRQRVGVVAVYEGWDGAGKAGNIKRLTQELDPRGYDVIPIAAPDATEISHHYLWRFWKQLPKAGHMAIFDRSWYGRVLVERVEGFATENEWRRAYQEINIFERHIESSGAVLFKFWLHISPEEQLRRFLDRETTPHKMHKISLDDWRARARWNDYRLAVSEMVERTSTVHAPWTIVEAEDKLWARVKTLSTLVGALEKRLKL